MSRKNNSHSLLGLIIVIVAVVLFLRACGGGAAGLLGFNQALFKAYITWTTTIALIVIVVVVAILLTVHFVNKKKPQPKVEDPVDVVLQKNNKVPEEAYTSEDPRVKALVPFATVKDVGNVASHGIRQLLTLDQKEKQLMDLVDEKFMKGSITYDRFATTILSGTATVRGNADVLAAKLASFDRDEYYRISTSVESGAFRRDMVDDDIQMARYDAYQRQIAEMKRIIDANEKLMLSLDECNVELSKLVSTQLDQHTESMLKEMAELTETTKYYS